MVYNFSVFLGFTLDQNQDPYIGTQFMGIQVEKSEKQTRFLSTLMIELIENIPQFIVVFSEMFKLRGTVTFM